MSATTPFLEYVRLFFLTANQPTFLNNEFDYRPWIECKSISDFLWDRYLAFFRNNRIHTINEGIIPKRKMVKS